MTLLSTSTNVLHYLGNAMILYGFSRADGLPLSENRTGIIYETMCHILCYASWQNKYLPICNYRDRYVWKIGKSKFSSQDCLKWFRLFLSYWFAILENRLLRFNYITTVFYWLLAKSWQLKLENIFLQARFPLWCCPMSISASASLFSQ